MEIFVKNIYKSFGNNKVLQGISLNIPAGKITIIVGGSGSGKSVLLKHLTGLVRPDKGEVIVDGRDIVPLPESALFPLRQRIAMIFQSGGLLASMSVGDNVALGLIEHRLAPKSKIPGIVKEKLALVHLEGKEDEMPANLSGGMRKRVSIARALTLNPELILYDEPTAGLDPPMAETIDDLILELARDLKVTTVVVTHDLISVLKLADTINMLHEGKIIESASPQDFMQSSNSIIKEFIKRK
ncbi:ATP-binding cassette domain-containing protein [Candidatus Sumerlaeota bacterium]|nr:ATP-binding cassette domain-containing protein [Candidatus Sumerlaeota bacterium]